MFHLRRHFIHFSSRYSRQSLCFFSSINIKHEHMIQELLDMKLPNNTTQYIFPLYMHNTLLNKCLDHLKQFSHQQKLAKALATNPIIDLSDHNNVNYQVERLEQELMYYASRQAIELANNIALLTSRDIFN